MCRPAPQRRCDGGWVEKRRHTTPGNAPICREAGSRNQPTVGMVERLSLSPDCLADLSMSLVSKHDTSAH
jgi:hypothetical protein